MDRVSGQVNDLNEAPVSVRLQLKYKKRVIYSDSTGRCDRFSEKSAPLIENDDLDEHAKGFDRFMLIILEEKSSFTTNKANLCDIASRLDDIVSLPQVKSHLPFIKPIQSDAFWNPTDLIRFEEVPTKLRLLMVLTGDKSSGGTPIYTNLQDVFSESKEGATLDTYLDFEDYRLKVNRYIEENKDAIAVGNCEITSH